MTIVFSIHYLLNSPEQELIQNEDSSKFRAWMVNFLLIWTSFTTTPQVKMKSCEPHKYSSHFSCTIFLVTIIESS